MLQSGNGLLHALMLDGRGGARPLTEQELAEGPGSEGFSWIHLDYTSPDAERWLALIGDIDPVVVAALLTAETRPRVSVVKDGLLVALRAVNLNPGADPEDMVAVRIWLDERRAITSLRRGMLSLDDLVAALNEGRGPVDGADFLVALCDSIVERIEPVVVDAEDRVAELEERLVAGRIEGLRREVAELRRQVIALRRYLAPQREAVNRLTLEKISWLDNGHRVALREIGDHLIRQIENLDVVRERAALTIEELASHLSEQLNHRLYVLSVAAAIFLPLTFITGLLGINVGGIPGSGFRWAFYVVVVFILVLLTGQLWFLRRRRWL